MFSYLLADGTTRRELRTDAEVFAADALSSFEALPVTDDHPPAMLTAATAARFARGASGDSVRRDGDHVAASLVVFDADLIAKMERGKVQVSNGYSCDLDETPGETTSGEKYDAVQVNIRGNHVAIVDSGRAGSARVRMDGVVERDDAASKPVMMTCPKCKGEQPCPDCNPKMDGAISMDLAKALEALGAEKARADAAATALDATKNTIAKLEAERDAEKSRADAAVAKAATDLAAAEKARKDAEDGFAGRVAARVLIEGQAHAVLGPDEKGRRDFATLSDRAIKVAVIKKVDAFDCPADKPDAYVDARFDVAVSRVAAGLTANDAARAALGVAHKDDGAPDGDAEKAALAKLRNDAGSAWKARI